VSAPAVVPLRRALSQAMIDRYASASGDFNPIHIDAAFAATTPMGGTIAHGMLVLALIAEMMTAAFGRDWLTGGKLEVRFRAPARPGDTLTARARAIDDDDDGDEGGSFRYAVECLNEREEQLITGTAAVAARGR